MRIIGDKLIFAVQYEVVKLMTDGSPYGKIIIWINNNFIGDWVDHDYLLNMPMKLSNAMELVQRSKAMTFANKSAQEIVDFIKDQKSDPDTYDDEIDVDKNIFSMNSSVFDDFGVRCYPIDEHLVNFIFYIRGEYAMKMMPDYPRGLQTGVVNVDYFYNIVEIFERELEELLQDNSLS
jgi:hypothetical protein